MNATDRTTAKNSAALQAKLGAHQIDWAISATVLIDLGSPLMRQARDGAVAATTEALHFYRRSLLGAVHETLSLQAVSSIQRGTVRFDDRQLAVVILNRNDGRGPWAVLAQPDQREFLIEQLHDGR